VTLQTTKVTAALTEQQRDVLLIYVHSFEQSSFAEDDHPTVYLHLAARLPWLANHFTDGKLEGQSEQTVKTLQNRAAHNKERLRSNYERVRGAYRDAYALWVKEAQPQFDLVVCCPSSRADAQFFHLGPVMQALRQRNAEARDLSPYFHKDATFWAGAGTIEQARKAITFDYDGRLEAANNALIIDDVWSKGTTVSVVIDHLVNSGLQANAQVTVFAPLWIPPKEKRVLNGCEY